MTYADKLFVQNCKEILDSPYSDFGMEVRPKWPKDGVPAHTKKIFGVCNRYDLRKEFPIMTLRRVFWKSALDELLWIYQKRSNDVRDLKSHVWDAWASADHTIGKAYGYQIGQKTLYPEGNMDQIEKVIWDLKHNPMSRSIITNTYNMQDLPEMNLRPCAYSMTFNVTRDGVTGEMILNGLLNQRSQDMLTANNWNTVQYGLLLAIIAHCVDMTPGILVHMIADCHIYDRHIPIVESLIQKAERGDIAYEAPKLWINPCKKDFFDFKIEDIEIRGYQYDDTKYTIPVAV